MPTIGTAGGRELWGEVTGYIGATWHSHTISVTDRGRRYIALDYWDDRDHCPATSVYWIRCSN